MVSPDDEEPNRIDLSEAQPETAEPPPQPPPPAPVKRKRRSIFASLLSTLLLLAVLAGAALYAAIAFKDRDERLKAVADYAEPYVDQGSVVFDELKNRLSALFGEKEPAQQEEPAQATAAAPEAPPAPPPEPAQTAPAQTAEPAQTTPASPEAPPAPPTESAETTPVKPAETAAEPTLNEQRPEPAANHVSEAQNAAIDAQKAAVAALQSRLESAEDLAQRALHAAEAAGAAANAAQAAADAAAKARPATDAAGSGPEAALTPSDQLAALEGRIDELGEEMKALRGRLDSPKGETRAAPEAAAAKTPEGPAALVVVSYALQRELEAGRPYAVEAKALTRLGADPAALAALSPFAEKGAPTAVQLKADFAPAAKRIHALEAGDSGDLAHHLMKGASKLVRVRPSGAPTGEARTVEEKVAHIDAALAHGDLAQAAALFATLPEAAQNEAKEFGATLRARIEAGQAAESLLHGAIAALVATKE
ncbi:MAG: COG4223 family protein [Methylocystis sp.]